MNPYAIYSELEISAAKFAAQCHKGMFRKYFNGPLPYPYIVHPAAVADIVRSVKHTDEMLAAAWLHDVVEDCNITLSSINEMFGNLVANYVASLTDVAIPSDGNRKIRFKINCDHSAAGCPESQTIKMADIIHNSYRMFQYAPKFAETNFKEHEQLFSSLSKADPILLKFAKRMTGTDDDYFQFEHPLPTTLYLIL